MSAIPVGDVARTDLRIRDPFVVPLRERGEYLMFGSNGLQEWGNGHGPGFDCYRSRDLETWHGPIPAFRPDADFWSRQDYWAPEVHAWRGRWYMLASFKAPGRCRATHALVADHPEGPYRPVSPEPLTPRDWECLDGTLHVEEGRPWLVFCHEWLQIRDGTICAVPLSDDLSRPIGEPLLLFRASQSPWTRENDSGKAVGRVTDGPWLHRADDGSLLLLWSSFADQWRYGLAIARSSGGLRGPWFHHEQPLVADDGGHGMLFRTFAGELRLSLHRPNSTTERAHFLPVREVPGGLALGGSAPS
jgi:hypothetical protein